MGEGCGLVCVLDLLSPPTTADLLRTEARAMLSSQLPLPVHTRPLRADASHPRPPPRTRGTKTDLPEDLQVIDNSPEKIARVQAFFDPAPLREMATAAAANDQVRST